MAATTNLKDFLTSLGFSEPNTYDAPKDPAGASPASVNAFIRENPDNVEATSCGVIHIAGPSIAENSAPVKAVGGLLTFVQGTVDTIGSSLAGVRSSHGAIPSSISGRTQMSLVASPMPGSVVIQVAPMLDRNRSASERASLLFEAMHALHAPANGQSGPRGPFGTAAWTVHESWWTRLLRPPARWPASIWRRRAA